MSTVQELKKRADELRKKTAVNSVTPDEVGSLIFDTIDYMYNIEANGIYKMMSTLAETDNPSGVDLVPVIQADKARKAKIETLVAKGIQDAPTHSKFDSVPVLDENKLGQMGKTAMANALSNNVEQNIPAYRPDKDTFDQIRIRKSSTGELFYIDKNDLAEVVGELAIKCSLKTNLLGARPTPLYAPFKQVATLIDGRNNVLIIDSFDNEKPRNFVGMIGRLYIVRGSSGAFLTAVQYDIISVTAHSSFITSHSNPNLRCGPCMWNGKACMAVELGVSCQVPVSFTGIHSPNGIYKCVPDDEVEWI